MELFNFTHLAILLGVFAVVTAVAFVVMQAFLPKSIRGRVEQAAGGTAATDSSELKPAPGKAAWLGRLSRITKPMSKLSVPKEGWETSGLRTRLFNAGWRRADTPTIFYGAKSILAIALPVIAALVLSNTPVVGNKLDFAVILIGLGALGYYLPNSVLSRAIDTRQRALLDDFPDAIDLLTVCVEAGLGINAALARVTSELELRSPVVAGEFELLLLEMRSGFTRERALRNMAMRTGVEDVDTFSSILIQAERFGTSVGDSLRVLSDTLRTRRRMRAEEQAAKIALKMLMPLMLCIFPTLLAVLMGPAAVNIYRTLFPALGGGS